ncbi:MAG: hypothetical protein ACI4KM_11725 [Oscillospiraceae bacterium]
MTKFLSTVCMAAIAAALFRLCVPGDKFAKQLSLLIACVFVLAGVSALSGMDFSLDYVPEEIRQTGGYISLSGDVDKELQRQISSEMSDKLYAILNENGIYPEEIHIITNISGLYSISITQVKLVFPKGGESAAQSAAALLEGRLSDKIKLVTQVKE